MLTKNQSLKNAIWISIIYFIFGLLWIYFSDSVVESIASDSRQLSTLQTYKGWFFITITTFFLFLLSYRFFYSLSLTYQKHLNQQIQHEQTILESKKRFDRLAHHDPLTGLPNRLSLIEILQIKTNRFEDHPFSLFFIDLDGFKEINDSYGHRFGDQILILFAKLLQDLFPKDTLILRTGGDEFVILLESKIDQHSIQIRLNRLIQALNDPFNIDQIEVFITASIGISLYPVDSSNAEELLQKADAAMYKAKNQGRNTYSFYNDGLTQEVLERTTLASNLKKAISNRDLSLYYQPQINP
ncbi:MAG: GGDEF domain-containing protein, partial [Sulfuricurvum sp.]|uniref:GGDEF domain-containing protein n=1 Tax=Sulfuricurvum sp. TaxID=2025608 RepID=UPI002732DC52